MLGATPFASCVCTIHPSASSAGLAVSVQDLGCRPFVIQVGDKTVTIVMKFKQSPLDQSRGIVSVVAEASAYLADNTPIEDTGVVPEPIPVMPRVDAGSTPTPTHGNGLQLKLDSCGSKRDNTCKELLDRLDLTDRLSEKAAQIADKEGFSKDIEKKLDALIEKEIYVDKLCDAAIDALNSAYERHDARTKVCGRIVEAFDRLEGSI
jgi:hypothetical protein